MAKIGVIKLYGEIGRWEYSGRNMSNILDELASTHDEIQIRMHCYGGEVFEGYAIFNAIKNCSKKVTVIIDGIAASMATIVMLAANEIQIARNGFIMIHSPSGSSHGNAQKHIDTAKLLRKLELSIKDEYASRTGKKSKDFNKYLDGSDYWFTAQEAKELGLVDLVIDPIEGVEDIDKDKAIDLGEKDLYARYTALLVKPDLSIKTTKAKKMKTIALKLGLNEDASESEILNKIAEIIASATGANAVKDELEILRTSNITAIVDAAVEAKQITADKKENFIAVGKASGVEVLKATLETIKPVSAKKVIDGLKPGADAAKSEYKKLSDVPSSEVAEMRKDDRATYVKLFKAEYGFEPEIVD